MVGDDGVGVTCLLQVRCMRGIIIWGRGHRGNYNIVLGGGGGWTCLLQVRYEGYSI